MTRFRQLAYWTKVGVVHALHYTGVLWLLLAIRLRRKAVVLMYHRVLSEEERAQSASHPALVVTRNTFASHMALVKRRFVVLTAQEFVERLERRLPFPDQSCLITFDDGWQDNYTNAFPILRRLQLPAVVFIPVNYIGTSRGFWQETLSHLLARALKAPMDGQTAAEVTGLLSATGMDVLLSVEAEQVDDMIRSVLQDLKTAPSRRVEDLINGLCRALRVRRDDVTGADRFMTWEQARRMKEEGIVFGGHGAEHRLLTYVSPEEATREIVAAKEAITRNLDVHTAIFSYPNGYMNSEIAALVQREGYAAAFTTDDGLVGRNTDRMAVPRMSIHEGVSDSGPMFLARMAGLL